MSICARTYRGKCMYGNILAPKIICQPLTNYIKIALSNILKPKNMINIPVIVAKYKKSHDLHDCLKIYRHLKYGSAKNSKKRDSLWEPKTWEVFLENQDFPQKSSTP